MSMESNAARLTIIRASRQVEQLIARVSREVKDAAADLPRNECAIVFDFQALADAVGIFRDRAQALTAGLDGAPDPTLEHEISCKLRDPQLAALHGPCPSELLAQADDENGCTLQPIDRADVDRRFAEQQAEPEEYAHPFKPDAIDVEVAAIERRLQK